MNVVVVDRKATYPTIILVVSIGIFCFSDLLFLYPNEVLGSRLF